MKRLALGGLWHETNTFVPGRTELDDFRNYQLHFGDEMVETYKGTGTEIGGAIDAASTAPAEIVPLGFAAATPSAIIAHEAYEYLTQKLMQRVSRAGHLDGVVLCLHGAMIAEGYPDADGELVTRIRSLVGNIPIAVTLDLHANPSDRLCSEADVLVAYDTFPHVDMKERGAEAVAHTLRIATTGRHPRAAFRRLPLLTVPQMQETDSEPMRSLRLLGEAAERRNDVWSISLLPGFPYSDVERIGFGVYVLADDVTVADKIADDLASAVWARRADFTPYLLPLADAMDEVDRESVGSSRGPIILVDVADNVGGGSPGDGAVVLRALEARGGRDGVIVVWDPVCVSQLDETMQDTATVNVGGHSAPEMGGPAVVFGIVTRLGNVRYSRSGSYMRGQVVDMGRVVVLKTAAGDVVVTEHRVMPFDDDHLRVVGIDPEKQRLIVVKSATAWKAAFGSYAERALFLRTPGYCPSDLRDLAVSGNHHSLYPISEDLTWPSI